MCSAKEPPSYWLVPVCSNLLTTVQSIYHLPSLGITVQWYGLIAQQYAKTYPFHPAQPAPSSRPLRAWGRLESGWRTAGLKHTLTSQCWLKEKTLEEWSNTQSHLHLQGSFFLTVKVLCCFWVLLNPSLVLSAGAETISALLILLLGKQPHIRVFRIFRLNYCNLGHVTHSLGKYTFIF